jgi:hypothetical protein
VRAAHGRAVRGRSGGGRRRGKCSSGVWNWALGVAEKHVGVEVVLLRARGRKLRHGRGLSTATRRWRPEMARGRRGVRVGSHQGRGKGSGLGGDDAWTCAAAGGGARGLRRR